MFRIIVIFSFVFSSIHAAIDSGGGSSLIGANINQSSIGGYQISTLSSLGSVGNYTNLVQLTYDATNLPIDVDIDTDGLPDSWEELYGLSTNIDDSDSDYDGDRMTAFEEYIAGTLPNNGSSFLQTSINIFDGVAEITINTLIGRNYHLLVTQDMETFVYWSHLAGNNSEQTFIFDPQSTSAKENFCSCLHKMFFICRVELTE